MIYKALGSLLLLMVGGYLSLSVSRYQRRRLFVLDAYLSLIYHIKGQIDCYAMPVHEILARVDRSVLAACRGFSEEEARRLAHAIAPVDSVPELIRESKGYLESESERLLMAFSAELGSTFREEQVKRCEYYMEALEEERSRLADAIPARIRVNSVLCVCGTLGLLILLW